MGTSDTDRRAALEALLGSIWTRLPEVFLRARRWGAAWEDLSRPFVVWEGDRPLAHVGLMSIRLLVAGREIDVGAIHAVCTHPRARHRGLATRLVGEALAASEAAGHTAQILFAVDPGFYARWGFRPLRTHVFVGRAPRVARPHRAVALDLQAEPDRALLYRFLADRAPTSEQWFVREPARLFVLNQVIQTPVERSIVHVPSLDAIVVYRRVEDLLYLEDVVARRMPSLEEIVASVAGPVRNVVVQFAPDRLPHASLRPDLWGDVDTMMVRGPILEDDGVLAVPPLTRW